MKNKNKKKKGSKEIRAEIAIGIILLVAIVIGGAFYLKSKKENYQITLEVENVANQKKEIKNNSENISIVDNEGWKKYTAVDGKFSVNFPDEWQQAGTIFTNSEGKKIAEFLPGIVVLQQNKRCLDYLKIDSTRMKLISQSNVSLNNNQGVLFLQEITQDPGGTVVYLSTYCLEKENRGFIMAFYDYNLNFSQGELFNKVISSLRF